MIISGGQYVIPDNAYVSITLANGCCVNISASGNVIVEAGTSDGFGEYQLTLPSVTDVATRCRELGHNDPTGHGEVPVTAYHRH